MFPKGLSTGEIDLPDHLQLFLFLEDYPLKIDRCVGTKIEIRGEIQVRKSRIDLNLKNRG